MSENSIEVVLAALGNKFNARGFRRFPEEGRLAALAFAQRELAKGIHSSVVAKQLGLNDWTLQRWLQRSRADALATTRPAFKRVKVRAQVASTESFRVAGPCGLQIEGLSLPALTELIRALSCSA